MGQNSHHELNRSTWQPKENCRRTSGRKQEQKHPHHIQEVAMHSINLTERSSICPDSTTSRDLAHHTPFYHRTAMVCHVLESPQLMRNHLRLLPARILPTRRLGFLLMLDSNIRKVDLILIALKGHLWTPQGSSKKILGLDQIHAKRGRSWLSTPQCLPEWRLLRTKATYWFESHNLPALSEFELEREQAQDNLTNPLIDKCILAGLSHCNLSSLSKRSSAEQQSSCEC
mmetsp:Transcript_80738/g.216442  ORF Transcript_80738/g.216442 Transcript_80738/m.216442 type:complete len:229 (+) Transcript_80738:4828-5514(+)